MQPLLNIATTAARAGGKIILRYVDRVESLSITAKQRNDFVSEVDHLAEREIIGVIHKAYPRHSILAEESGEQRKDEEFQWIIDPLDGTTNFLHGFPQFCVSIALKRRGRIELGVIYDPLKEELFTAHRGSGAQLDNRRIRVSRARDLQGALLGTGIPYRPDQHNLDEYLQTLKALIVNTAGVRRAGAAALDLAYVACGRLDGFWEFGLRPWDIAAGALMVQEAGGLVSDMAGGETFMETGNIVAANPKVFKMMVQVLKPFAGYS